MTTPGDSMEARVLAAARARPPGRQCGPAAPPPTLTPINTAVGEDFSREAMALQQPFLVGVHAGAGWHGVSSEGEYRAGARVRRPTNLPECRDDHF